MLITAESISKGFRVISQIFLITRVHKALFPMRDPFIMPFIPIGFKSHDKLGFYPIWCVNNGKVSIKRFKGHIASVCHHTGSEGAISSERPVCHVIHPAWL